MARSEFSLVATLRSLGATVPDGPDKDLCTRINAAKVARCLNRSGWLGSAQEDFTTGGCYGESHREVFPDDEDDASEDGDENPAREAFKSLGVSNIDDFRAVQFKDAYIDLLLGKRTDIAVQRLALETVKWILETEMMEWADNYRDLLVEYANDTGLSETSVLAYPMKSVDLAAALLGEMEAEGES